MYDSVGEFLDHNPTMNIVFDWRKGNEGDWVMADDGGVIQLLKVNKSVKNIKQSVNKQIKEKVETQPTSSAKDLFDELFGEK